MGAVSQVSLCHVGSDGGIATRVRPERLREGSWGALPF